MSSRIASALALRKAFCMQRNACFSAL